MLKFRQTSRPPSRQSSTLPPPPPIACRASIVISDVSLPLAWSPAEYFEQRGEYREFAVCLSVKALGGRLITSAMHYHVDRSVPDIKFTETFAFHDLQPDFTIEAMVSAKRVAVSRPGALHTVSRSVGRRLGAALKKYNNNNNNNSDYYSAYTVHLPRAEATSPDDLLPMARCFFRLANAGTSGKVRVYQLAVVRLEQLTPGLNPLDLLPIFGTISCKVLCRPDCLHQTLARSIVDVFYTNEKLLLQAVDCSLQGGTVKCVSRKNNAMVLPVNKNTRVEKSIYQSSIRLVLSLPGGPNMTREFMLVLKTPQEVSAWIEAFDQALTNARTWGDFSSVYTNPHAARLDPTWMPEHPVEATRGMTMTNTDHIQTALKAQLDLEDRGRGTPRPTRSGTGPVLSSATLPRRLDAVFNNRGGFERPRGYETPSTSRTELNRPDAVRPMPQSVFPRPGMTPGTPKLGGRPPDAPSMEVKKPEPPSMPKLLSYKQNDLPPTPKVVRRLNDAPATISRSYTRQETTTTIPSTYNTPQSQNKPRSMSPRLYERQNESYPPEHAQTLPRGGTPKAILRNKNAKAPPNTYVIRLSVGMDSDDEGSPNQNLSNRNQARKLSPVDFEFGTRVTRL